MVFPKKDIFEDVKASEYNKYNKKHVSEDFILENLKEIGWFTYVPFTDTGIDIIGIKKVCPENHTDWNEDTRNMSNCDKNGCNKSLIHIQRYIQVKTRNLDENNVLGYTLTSTDIRTDPRHIFFLYSDLTNEVLILPMYEYMKFFYNAKQNNTIGSTHFSTPDFRQNNARRNTLKRHDNGVWRWGARQSSPSFQRFLNEEGIKLMSNPEYDLKQSVFAKEISEMKLELFYNFSGGRSDLAPYSTIIQAVLTQKLVPSYLDSIVTQRKDTRNRVKNSLRSKPDLLKSVENYFVQFRELKGFDT